jgi:glycosyltransferase involved in cell wall biosynthesis
MAKKIAMYNLADTRRDPRVRRIASGLAKQGFEVRVFEFNPGFEPAQEAMEKFLVQRLPAPAAVRYRDMQAIPQACPAAGEVLDSLDRDVLHNRVGRFRMTFHRGRRAIKRRLRKLRGYPPDTLEELRGGDRMLELRSLRLMMMNNLWLARAAIAWEPDYIHCNDLNTLLAGFMVKTVRKIPLIYDAHEIYAEQFPVDQRSDRWHAFYTGLERQLIRHTDARMTVCDAIGDYFQEQYGSGKVFTVRNMPSVRFLPPKTILERKVASPRFLYHGLFFAFRGLEEVIDAAAHLKDGHIFLRGLGYHEQALKQRVVEKGVQDRVTFLPAVAVDDLVGKATEFDVGLNPFVSACKNTEVCLPNKFFEYTMAGLASACTNLIELSSHVNRYDLGVLFEPGSATALAEGLNELARDRDRLQQCRENAYWAAYRELNWETERRKVGEVYASIR